MPHFRPLFFCLAAVFAGSAAAAGSYDAQFPPVIGKCAKNVKTRFVAGCAAIKPEHDEYGKAWSMSTEVEKPGAQILAAKASDVKVLEASSMTGKVLVSYSYEGEATARRAWVNPDALECSDQNLSGYRFPNQKNERHECLYIGGAPIDEATLKDASWTKLASSTGETLVSRAFGYAMSYQILANKDMYKLQGYFEKDIGLSEGSVGTAPESWPASKDPARNLALVERIRRSKLEIEKHYQEAIRHFPTGYCDDNPADKTEYTALVQAQRTCRMLTDARNLLSGIGVPEHPTPAEAAVAANAFRRLDVQHIFPVLQQRPDTLAFRSILFYGLSPAEQNAAKLNLVRDNNEIGAVNGKNGGSTPPFKELHSGYVYGSSSGSNVQGDDFKQDKFAYGNGTDCSQFIDDLFRIGRNPSQQDKSIRDVNVLTMEEIGNYHRGVIKKSALDANARAIADCFALVDIRHGGEPQQGDIVTVPGHIVLVNAYSASTGTVQTVEAGGSSMNTVGFNERPIFDAPCFGTSKDGDKWQVRPVKPGLKVLRFTGPSKGCPLSFPK